MWPGKMTLAVVGALAFHALCVRPAVAQTLQGPSTAETIKVTDARPVAAAMDVIEKKYGVLIDYVDAEYAAPQDTEGISYRPGHITVGPKISTVSVQYTEVAGKPEGVPYLRCNAATIGCTPVTSRPEGGVTALIEQVLNQFATQGGQVFTVRKIEMPYGPRWEVYPEQVRDESGTFRYQPDVLGAGIYIPKKDRTLAEMLGEICNQLSLKWGRQFGVASAPNNVFFRYHGELSADNVTARRALAGLMGETLVLRLFYAPDDGKYYVNIVNLPYRPPPRPSPPPAPKPAVQRPISLSPADWLDMAGTGKGVEQLQAGLAKSGYLHTAPTTRWDADASDAIRRFQTANSLLATGKIDGLTIQRLEPYLPKFQPAQPPQPNPLGPHLLYWLQSTRRGWTEVQTALAEEGFYKGPATGTFDLRTRNALKAYQTANGLAATGLFDDPTSRKLAPLLLHMRD
ncbi:MAG: peptidoglycan-binding protein [Acidobacteriota bacterium]|nr:peptidoglycan-binding protein [Acidobacteriota bacterium]